MKKWTEQDSINEEINNMNDLLGLNDSDTKKNDECKISQENSPKKKNNEPNILEQKSSIPEILYQRKKYKKKKKKKKITNDN